MLDGRWVFCYGWNKQRKHSELLSSLLIGAMHLSVRDHNGLLRWEILAATTKVRYFWFLGLIKEEYLVEEEG